ncbi:MAG TPA: hypothetical protein VGN34_15990, partial [Ktedonobacteraceae bacterium]
IAGDLTGKAIIPIIHQGSGHYRASLSSETYEIDTQNELQQLQKRMADRGYYPYITTPEEVEDLHQHPQRMDELFHAQIIQRVTEWVALAEERLRGMGVQFYMMPGNDDPFAIDEVIAQSSFVVNPVGRTIALDTHHELVSFAHSNRTPWKLPREWDEEEYYQRIIETANAVKHIAQAVFMIHVPPYDSGLDSAPALDEQLRPKATMGGLLTAPVGSTGVRRALQELQPLVSIHGHIHESPGQGKIGRTVCLNAGSEYAQGILRGFIFDLGKDKLARAFRVQG